MSNFWLKLRIWTKVAVVTVALVYIIAFSVKNSEPQAKATFWYFFNAGELETSTFKLVAGAFASGIVVALLARTTFRTIGQVRELRARQAVEAKEREYEALKAAATKEASETSSLLGSGDKST